MLLLCCPDAAAEHPVSAETLRVTSGTPGPQRDDHGLRLAGGGERHGGGISGSIDHLCITLTHILYSLLGHFAHY